MLKFGIGTSQYINNYGLLKKSINKKKFINLIKKKTSHIDVIDTAPSYNNAENIIGKYSDSKFKIITKFNKLKSISQNKKFNELEKGFKKSLKNLGKKKIHGILFHDVEDINFLKNDYLKKKFKKLIKNSVYKIGFSTYELNNIEKYLKIFKFDIIQIPINPFNIDKKKITFLKKIKKKYKIQIHARSLFLQGLSLENTAKLPVKFKLLKNKIIKIDKLIQNYNISRYDFFISFIKSLKIIDYAIIGMSSEKDFDSLKNAKLIKISEKYIFNFKIKNQRLVDPRFWNL